MHRPTFLPVIALALALAVPASASADSITVDPADANGTCTRGSDNVCKTIAAAIAAAQAGDVISILKGDYAESPNLPADKGDITIEGATGVRLTGASTGDVFTVAGNNVKVKNLSIEVPTNGGSAVKVDGTGVEIEGLVAARKNTSDVNDPVIDVLGSLTLRKAIVSQEAGVAGTAAIRSTGAGGTVLEDVLTISFKGPAVTFSAGDTNRIVRSTLLSVEPDSHAVVITSAGNSPTAKKLVMDSTAIVGGAKAAGVFAKSEAGNPSTAGDITIEGRHVTIAGSARGVFLDASAANGAGLIPAPKAAGNITATFLSSIVHGASEDRRHAPIAPLLSTPNTATINYQNSDAPPETVQSGDTDTAKGDTNTEDAKLFAPNSLKLRADAPLIDKGSAPVPDESDKDLDGQPRVSDGDGNGSAQADIGADEFVNLAPKTLIAATNPKPKEGEAVGFIAGATDPEEKSGGGIVEYRWDFGDGAKQTTKVAAVAHTFPTRGAYTVSVVVVDRQGAVSPAATQPVTVVDGSFPQVSITSPANGARLVLNKKAKKAKKGSKKKPKTPKPLQLNIVGSASDESGIAKIEVAIFVRNRDRVRGKKYKPLAKDQCEFYSGRLLARKACNREIWIPVVYNQATKSWSLKTRKGLRLPAGTYEIQVRATDGSGLMTQKFDVKDKTQIKFRVK